MASRSQEYNDLRNSLVEIQQKYRTATNQVREGVSERNLDEESLRGTQESLRTVAQRVEEADQRIEGLDRYAERLPKAMDHQRAIIEESRAEGELAAVRGEGWRLHAQDKRRQAAEAAAQRDELAQKLEEARIEQEKHINESMKGERMVQECREYVQKMNRREDYNLRERKVVDYSERKLNTRMRNVKNHKEEDAENQR